MGKRSDFERNPRDYYPTPIAAVEPLLDHLPYEFDYVEPCAGDGRLVNHIHDLTNGTGRCLHAADIEPQGLGVIKADAMKLDMPYKTVDFVITNPPWDRKILHPMIERFVFIAPTWLLFDADWMHTKQSAVYMSICSKIVSIGRVKWIEDSKSTGKDNCCWYLFDVDSLGTPPQFYGRLL